MEEKRIRVGTRDGSAPRCSRKKAQTLRQLAETYRFNVFSYRRTALETCPGFDRRVDSLATLQSLLGWRDHSIPVIVSPTCRHACFIDTHACLFDQHMSSRNVAGYDAELRAGHRPPARTSHGSIKRNSTTPWKGSDDRWIKSPRPSILGGPGVQATANRRAERSQQGCRDFS